MKEEYTIYKENNTFDYATRPNEEPLSIIIERSRGIIVTKTPGYKRQQGIAMWEYMPAVYRIWQMVSCMDCNSKLKGYVLYLTDFPISPKLQNKNIVHHTSIS